MDSENELARAKWLLLSIGLFLITGCMSWGEFMYLVAGNDAQAEVVKAFETTRRGRTRLTVEYTFSEPDGTRRKGTDTVSS